MVPKWLCVLFRQYQFKEFVGNFFPLIWRWKVVEVYIFVFCRVVGAPIEYFAKSLPKGGIKGYACEVVCGNSSVVTKVGSMFGNSDVFV